MPIEFEEITGRIEREPQIGAGSPAQQPEPVAIDDLPVRLEQELRLRAERNARLVAD